MRKLGAAALVIVGLLVLGESASLFFIPLSVLFNNDAGGSMRWLLFAVSFLPALVVVVFGAFLIVKRTWLSERWFEDSTPDLPLDAVSFLRVALIITGVWMIAQGLLGLLQSAASIVQTFSADGGGSGVVIWSTLYMVAPRILYLGIGAALIRWSAPFASRLWSGRTAPETSMISGGPTCPSCGTPYNPDDYRPGVARNCDSCGRPLDGAPNTRIQQTARSASMK